MDEERSREGEPEASGLPDGASVNVAEGGGVALSPAGNKETGNMDNGTSQSHKNLFFPMFGYGLFKETMEKQMEQFGATLSELEKMERERIERTEAAIDDMTRLAKASLSYSHQIMGEWRKLNIEAVKRAMNVLG